MSKCKHLGIAFHQPMNSCLCDCQELIQREQEGYLDEGFLSEVNAQLRQVSLLFFYGNSDCFFTLIECIMPSLVSTDPRPSNSSESMAESSRFFFVKKACASATLYKSKLVDSC